MLTTLALMYTTSPTTTLPAESTTVTEGKQLRLCVIVHVDEEEVCVWVYVPWALAGDPAATVRLELVVPETVTFLLTWETVNGLTSSPRHSLQIDQKLP